MIIELPDTTTGEINNALVNSRKEGGVVTLGRVMTLVIDATGADAEDAIATANVAAKCNPRPTLLMPNSMTPKNPASRKKAVSTSYAISGPITGPARSEKTDQLVPIW